VKTDMERAFRSESSGTGLRGPIEIDYHGTPAGRIRSDHLAVDFLTQAGPRIVGLRLAGRSENLLAELPEVHWKSPHGEYHVYGGHRLWIGPETAARTYVPDDRGLTVREAGGALELIGAREAPTSIRKSMTIALASDRPALTITHRIVNEGSLGLELAPWAITQLPLGGTVILPQARPASAAGNADAEFQPRGHLVLWNYAHWDDPRLDIQDQVILLHARPQLPACKIGTFDTAGWAAYLHQGTLFCKRFTPQPTRLHTDRFCNLEVYCNDLVVELETLGPLVHLDPGGGAEHIEDWDLIPGLPADLAYDQVVRIVVQGGTG